MSANRLAGLGEPQVAHKILNRLLEKFLHLKQPHCILHLDTWGRKGVDWELVMSLLDNCWVGPRKLASLLPATSMRVLTHDCSNHMKCIIKNLPGFSFLSQFPLILKLCEGLSWPALCQRHVRRREFREGS